MFRLYLKTIIILSSLFGLTVSAAPIDILSPSGKLKVTVYHDKVVSYVISFDGKDLLRQNDLTLTTTKGTLGHNARLISFTSTVVHETKQPVVPLKFSRVEAKYRKALLKFKGNYSIEFRVMDNAVAYRFITKLGKVININDESFKLQ